jgi:hypothetical protein
MFGHAPRPMPPTRRAEIQPNLAQRNP